MSEPQSWDVAIAKSGNAKFPASCINLPASLGRAIAAKGMWRATVTVTKEGILVVPYVAVRSERQNRAEIVELPDSWGGK
jgi:hypothetical protein